MAMVADLVNQILEAARVGETSDWEFKSAKGGFPGSFWETYSAMANAEGGVVVLGVRETEADAALDGLSAEQIGRYQKTLWDGLNNRGQVSLNLLEARDVQAVEVGGVRLLAIRIPRATRTQRPVHLGGTPLGNTYRRRHEGDYRCSDAEVRRLLADADETPRDQQVMHGFGLDDLDAASLRQYRQRLRAARGDDHPWIALDDSELLERLGGWTTDRLHDEQGLTLAGLLMFGKDLAIRHPQGVPNYFVDYREKLYPDVRWSDRVYPDGTWEANLFQFYQRVWPKLSAGLPTPFRLEGIERRDVTPQHEALREAFVNAIIHADYAGVGGVVVERYPDRFMVENPGTLLVSLQQYAAGGVSECRNKALQQMFLMIGGGERAGSGTDKIRSAWRAKHWRTPKLEVRSEPDRVRLTLPMVSLIPEETLARLREQFGGRIDTLAPSELQTLATIDIEGSVSNARLQEVLTDHPTDITRMLGRLCADGMLVSDKRRRWTTYQIATLPAGDSSHLEGDSPHIEEGLPTHRANSPHMGTELDPLEVIAAPVASSRRASPEAITKVILELCMGRFLTAEQLGQLLHRNPNGLRDRYLTPLLAAGRLRLRFSAATNRPDQAYTAVQPE